MLVKNDWLSTNFEERVVDKNIPFRASFRPYKFKEKSFDDACNDVCLELYEKYENLSLAFSGGMDSEYILRKFHSMNIPILPIIVCCRNPEEERYAFKICKELKIVPKVIQLSEYDFLKYYKKYIYEQLGCPGYNSTQIVVAKEFSETQKSTLIVGGNLIGEDDFINDEKFVWISDIDLYADHFFQGVNNINFYFYNMEIVYAMLPKEYSPNIKWQEYKSVLYGVEYREKIKAKYSEQTKYILDKMHKKLANRNYEICSWSKSEVLEIFNNYKV